METAIFRTNWRSVVGHSHSHFRPGVCLKKLEGVWVRARLVPVLLGRKCPFSTPIQDGDFVSRGVEKWTGLTRGKKMGVLTWNRAPRG